MKKYMLTLVAALTAIMVSAQTEVLRINLGDRIVTYNVADIKEMTFDTVAENPDTTLLHSFGGYIFVTTRYFQDQYYGNDARLEVYRTTAGENIVRFWDPAWGEGIFANVSVGMQLDGEGVMTIPNYQGTTTDYEATIGGPMTQPVITIPSLMGGTTITFTPGEAVSGDYDGSVSVVVGGQFGPYVVQDVAYGIQPNSDGTINVVMPQYVIPGTVMGDLTLGSYTVSNIAYDEEKGAYYRDYADDGLTLHLTAVSDGNTTMDNDYSFTMGTIQVTVSGSDVTVVNSFQPGSMPFPIVATYEGSRQ